MLNVAHDPAVNSQVYSHRPAAKADQGGGPDDFGTLVDSNTVAADRDIPVPAPQDRPVRQASDNDRPERRDTRADADAAEKPQQAEPKTGVLNAKAKKSASHPTEKGARTGVVADKPKLKSKAETTAETADDASAAAGPAAQATPDATAPVAVVTPPAVPADGGEISSSPAVSAADAGSTRPTINPAAVAAAEADAAVDGATEADGAPAAGSVAAEKPKGNQKQAVADAIALVETGEAGEAAPQPAGIVIPQPAAAGTTSIQATDAAEVGAVQAIANGTSAKAAPKTATTDDGDAKPGTVKAKTDGDADEASAADTRTDATKPGAASVKKEQASAATGPAQAHHGAEPQGAKPDVSFQAALDLQAPVAQQAQPQQQFTVTVAGPTASAQAASIPVPVNGLAVDIATRAAAGNTSFQIRLDPADLGRIDVRLDVDKHGRVTSHLTVDQPATLDMLRKDAPQLQRALEDAGLKTGDGGLQFSLRDQSPQGRQDDGAQARASHRLIVSEDVAAPPPVVRAHYGRTLGSSTGVDISI